MSTQIAFKKAVKYEAKGRVALVGPSGSGKSLTMLEMATLLAEGGLITAVDTEHGSLSKYADAYNFNVIEPDTFSPDVFFATMEAARAAGSAVHCVDSLSHFWMGQGGALEWVDLAKKRSSSRDDMAGWKDFSPIERRMIDAIISAPFHVIVTMRTKTEYMEEEYTNSQGQRKKKRVKIGLEPVQRKNMEYEFDLIGYMNEDNEFVTDKTRCSYFKEAGAVISRPKSKNFQPFAEWLRGAPADRNEKPPAPTVGPELVQTGTIEAAQAVAQRKIAEMKNKEAPDAEREKAMAEAVAAYDAAIDRAKRLLKSYCGDRTDSAFLNGAYPKFWDVDKWANVAKMNPALIEVGNDKLKEFLQQRNASLPIWETKYAMWEDFKGEKERIGDADYYAILEAHPIVRGSVTKPAKHANDYQTPAEGMKCFLALRSHEVVLDEPEGGA